LDENKKISAAYWIMGVYDWTFTCKKSKSKIFSLGFAAPSLVAFYSEAVGW
jgi:hypothetical protein